MIAATLRARLTPFGESLAAVLPHDGGNGLTLRVLSAEEAVEPMRHILERHGLTEKKRIGYRDGTRGVSWHDDPRPYIQQWVNQESVIVLQSDESGPVSLRFATRIASDTIRTDYMIGVAGAPSDALIGAIWDLGIRTLVSWTHRDRQRVRTEAGEAALVARGVVSSDEADGEWIKRTTRLERRP